MPLTSAQRTRACRERKKALAATKQALAATKREKNRIKVAKQRAKKMWSPHQDQEEAPPPPVESPERAVAASSERITLDGIAEIKASLQREKDFAREGLKEYGAAIRAIESGNRAIGSSESDLRKILARPMSPYRARAAAIAPRASLLPQVPTTLVRLPTPVASLVLLPTPPALLPLPTLARRRRPPRPPLFLARRPRLASPSAIRIRPTSEVACSKRLLR
jgi:hypothetical protein